jgi:hypothetical protein
MSKRTNVSLNKGELLTKFAPMSEFLTIALEILTTGAAVARCNARRHPHDGRPPLPAPIKKCYYHDVIAMSRRQLPLGPMIVRISKHSENFGLYSKHSEKFTRILRNSGA